MGSFGMEKYKREDVFGVFLSFSKMEFFSRSETFVSNSVFTP